MMYSLAELSMKTVTASAILSQEAQGKLPVPLEAVIDAKSVFDA